MAFSIRVKRLPSPSASSTQEAQGICTTAALTGTLQPGGGVTSPGPAQNYGSICSGGAPAAFRNFTFTVDPALPCGSTVTASLAVVDGATNYGTFTYVFPTGSTVNSVLQNFDGVVAPALPAGWTTTFSGLGTAVTTSTVFPDTAPNDIFLSEASNVALSEVTRHLAGFRRGAESELPDSLQHGARLRRPGLGDQDRCWSVSGYPRRRRHLRQRRI